jgi:hypothetical protein
VAAKTANVVLARSSLTDIPWLLVFTQPSRLKARMCRPLKGWATRETFIHFRNGFSNWVLFSVAFALRDS